MELARAWLPGVLPGEVRELLQTQEGLASFVPARGLAEAKTRLDCFRGNCRNHDLLVLGQSGAGVAVLLDVEGKADEPFDRTVRATLDVAARKPRSNVPQRVQLLAQAVFGCSPDEIGDLRYQLLQATAACLIEARKCCAGKAVFIVHEFVTDNLSDGNRRANVADFEAFLRRLAGDPCLAVESGVLYGPLRLKGSERVPSDIDLFLGKATRDLRRLA
jgi:hypothetical protein